MRRMKLAVLGVMLCISLGAAAPAPAEDPEATVVEELVVQALERGPAWWRVSDGDTVVYIFGMPPVRRPGDAAWDSALLQRRLAGAHTVILGSIVVAKLRDVGAVWKLRRRLLTDEPLEETLPPPLRDRFVRARTSAKQPAKRYERWNPMIAGEVLFNDTMKARGLTPVAFEKIVNVRLRQKPAPTKIARVYAGTPLVQTAVGGLTEATSLACLENALEGVEAPTEVYRQAFEGWATGDVAAALKAPRGFEVCIRQLSGGATFWRRMTNDTAMDITVALAKPGHAVVLIGLRQIVAEGGLIQTLEAKGFRVQGPGVPD